LHFIRCACESSVEKCCACFFDRKRLCESSLLVRIADLYIACQIGSDLIYLTQPSPFHTHRRLNLRRIVSKSIERIFRFLIPEAGLDSRNSLSLIFPHRWSKCGGFSCHKRACLKQCPETDIFLFVEMFEVLQFVTKGRTSLSHAGRFSAVQSSWSVKLPSRVASTQLQSALAHTRSCALLSRLNSKNTRTAKSLHVHTFSVILTVQANTPIIHSVFSVAVFVRLIALLLIQ